MTQAQTLTLADFLLARITEQKRHAEALWVTMTQSDTFTAPAHIVNLGALLDPRKVIAECETKRKIVELHHDEHGYCAKCCQWQDVPEWTFLPDAYPCPTLRALTLPYADHPDYRDEWRP